MLMRKMLELLNIDSSDELFSEIPEEARIAGLSLPAGIDERELLKTIDQILSKNKTMEDMPSFLGGGVYRHFIPAAVHEIVSRSEFYTSYTPYQPEASQGMLQALFEYQSFMTELTGMEVVNSSMYDWSTALGEAAMMCSRLHPGTRFLISRAVSPQRKAVLETYLKGIDVKVQEIPQDRETGMIDINNLDSRINEDITGLYLENPNYFGILEENVDEVGEKLGEIPFVVGVNPISLAILKAPSEYGADIVIGEGHHLGTGPNLGGPLLGIFGCKKEHIRKMPGRIVGATVDVTGRRAFCLTLQTREQHIRRDKATSNICTNEAMMAVAASAYLASIGRDGLIKIALENMEKTHELSGMISKIKGYESPIFRASYFNEFVIGSKIPIEKLNQSLLKKGLQGGVSLRGDFPELGESMLLSVSEMHTSHDFKLFTKALEEIK